MKIVIIILLICMVISSMVLIAVMLKSRTKENDNDSISVSGGVEVYSGRIINKSDNFKGVPGGNGTLSNFHKNNGINLMIKNISNNRMINANIQKSIIIGRSKEKNVICISDDKRISRNHCCLFVQNSCLYIKDMGSSNKTFLNNKIVETSARCNSGDVIRIGNTELLLQYNI